MSVKRFAPCHSCGLQFYRAKMARKMQAGMADRWYCHKCGVEPLVNKVASDWMDGL